MADFQFQLKTAPPRAARNAPVRKRLERRWAEINDRTTIVVVTAPQGFGKTTLLAQWRRSWLERGAFVAWASLDSQDDPARFVDLLSFALRAATGQESFAMAAAQTMLPINRELDALTILLAEVTSLATPTVLVLDDAHRMPQETMRELLAYLLNNAPPNLQFLIGTRRPLERQLTDLIATGRMTELDARDLRLGMDESLEALRGRFGERITLDDAVRLHEITEGWPLGLQLAAATIERAHDLRLSDIAREGRLAEARDWIHRLPPQALQWDVRLQIRVAWITALGDETATAPALIEQARRHPQFDDACRFEAALVNAATGTLCDKPSLIADALEGWESSPNGPTPMHVGAWVNSKANLAFLRGRFQGRPPIAGPVAQFGASRTRYAPLARLRRHVVRPELLV